MFNTHENGWAVTQQAARRQVNSEAVTADGNAPEEGKPCERKCWSRAVKADCADDCDADTIEITFEVHNGHTEFGESYYVVGSLPDTGEWDLCRALRMDCTQSYPLWRLRTRIRPQGAQTVCYDR